MRQLPLSIGIILLAVTGPSPAARAAGEPLLVVVETEPGVDVAPADVRAAVGRELNARVLSPKDAKASEAGRVLVVTLDGRAIRVALRESASEQITRTVAAPAGQSARLQTIAWLAGNLARDQVTEIVDSPPSRAAAEPMPVAPGNAPAIEPAPLAPASLVPPSSASANSISITSSRRNPNLASEWIITAAGGPLVVPYPYGSASTDAVGGLGYGSAYELRVQHQSEGHDLNLGLALTFGELLSSFETPFFGVSGLIGKRWDRRRWFCEVTGGIGVGVAESRIKSSTSTFSSVSGITKTLVDTGEYQPGLFATARGSLGLPLSGSLDALAELGVSVGPLGLQTDYVSPTIALRLHLP